MTLTIQILVLALAGLWGLVCLVFVLALCRAARRATPTVDATAQWQGELHDARLPQSRARAEELQTARS